MHHGTILKPIKKHRNVEKRKCTTPYCRGIPPKYRKQCSKCRSRKYKKEHPFKYSFNYHRNNARKRNISWELSFEEFKKLWLRSGKWEKKKRGEAWEMHRLDPDQGYKKENIVIIKKALHVEITAIENGWKVDFEYRGRTKEQKEKDNEIFGSAPF